VTLSTTTPDAEVRHALDGEDDGHLEGEEPEESRDLGEIQHPGVFIV
jgi:hypothetical protein